MNQTFWDLFSDDYTINCKKWDRCSSNPVVPPSGSGWKSRWTANPDIIKLKDKSILYYRGNGLIPDTDGFYHDRIGASEIKNIISLRELNDGIHIIDVGEEGSFDCDHVLDPAAVVFNDRIFLYYSAIGSGPDSIGLAVSEDGSNFIKNGRIMNGSAPEAVIYNDRLYLFYQKANNGVFDLHLAVSGDGINFDNVQPEPVLEKKENSWDSFSITTARVLEHEGTYYMLYGGSSYLADEPDYFGLARSKNLINWEKHPGNPIFGCGAKGDADGGAIWYPALYEIDNRFILLYEGSRGKYSWDLSSAICMASIEIK